MNIEGQEQASGTSSSSNGGGGPGGSGQDTNGNPASSSSSSDATTTSNNLGARPKIRRNIYSHDQVVPLNNSNENQEDHDENDSEDDFYVYRYTGNGLRSNHGGHSYDDDDLLEVADLPKSFFRLDVGSDSESLPHSLGGVSGAGQSNLSTEVAALIQSEMASQSRRQRQQQQQQQQNVLQQQRAALGGAESPDMDFLEMDFDPGESDSDDPKSHESSPEMMPQRPRELRLDVLEEPAELMASAASSSTAVIPEDQVLQVDSISTLGHLSAPLQSPAIDLGCSSIMTRSRSLNSPLAAPQLQVEQVSNFRNKRRHSGEDGLCTASSSSSASMSAEVNLELCGARLSQREALVFGVPGSSSSSNVHRAMLKLRMLDTSLETSSGPAAHDEVISRTLDQIECCANPEPMPVEKTMIWTELEACKRQVNQIGVSACGATALINVLQALEFPYELENVIKTVPTKLRAESAPIPEYLFSRSVAGTSHQDLIEAMASLTDGQVIGRFFHFYPQRKVSLLSWLSHWLKQGAVPVATLNPQRGLLPGQTVPDAWHHQMLFGVSPAAGVYLTNPLESVSANLIWEQLCSESELLVRRSDVASRWHPTCDLQSLANFEADERWDHYNVLGQVVDLLREDHQRPILASPVAATPAESGSGSQTSPVTTNVQRAHVRIPAVYRSGITLFVNRLTHPECHQELLSCPELPISSHS